MKIINVKMSLSGFITGHLKMEQGLWCWLHVTLLGWDTYLVSLLPLQLPASVHAGRQVTAQALGTV